MTAVGVFWVAVALFLLLAWALIAWALRRLRRRISVNNRR